MGIQIHFFLNTGAQIHFDMKKYNLIGVELKYKRSTSIKFQKVECNVYLHSIICVWAMRI